MSLTFRFRLLTDRCVSDGPIPEVIPKPGAPVASDR